MLYRFDACEFQPSARRLLVGGVAHVLGGRAFDLLLALVENHDRVMSKDELYERVWPGLAVEPNNLQVQVWALRKILGSHAIATVSRRGYRFMPAVVGVPAGEATTKVKRSPRQGAWVADARGALATRLARHLAEHRLVTLVSPDAAAGEAVVQAAAQVVATDLAGGVWQTEADALTGQRAKGYPAELHGGEAALQAATQRLHALLQRVGRRPGVLVVLNAHLADGVRCTVQQLLADLPRLRLVVSHTQPLKLQGEKVVQAPAQAEPAVAPAAVEPAGSAAGHMRWRSRA